MFRLFLSNSVTFTIYIILLKEGDIISNYIDDNLDSINAQIINITDKLTELPPGKLICSRNGNTYKYYQNINNEYHYIYKKDRALVKELALKNYLQLQLQDLKHHKEYILFKQKYSGKYTNKATLLLSKPPYTELLADYFKPYSSDAIEWMSKDCEPSPNHPENLVHKSISGNTLRSKSEVLIDMLLFNYGIAYRYECALQLSNTTIYPDFTINHPKSNIIYYWEHCGMIDNSSYYNDFTRKLKLYIDNNIIPTHNLILTYETKDNPLTTDTIEKTIHYYFLD